MKKKLLLTSIVMMLVIAVALSTATYAWFTSNSQVTASTVTLTAESGAGVALGIGWDGGETGTSITANSALTYNPMVPSALGVGTTTFSQVSWSGATTYVDNGVSKFNEPYSVTPYQYNGTVSGNVKNIFYIENLSQANTISSITLTLSNVSDTNSLLRVAVFTSSTVGGTYTLQAVLGASADLDTEWGTVQENGVVEDLTNDGAEVATVTSYVMSNLSAQGKIFFKVVAWLDGVALDDSTANSTGTLGLNFRAA